MTAAVPLALCAGAVAVAAGTVIGAASVVGAVGYGTVIVPGQRAKDSVSRAWRSRQAAADSRQARCDLDPPEDPPDVAPLS